MKPQLKKLIDKTPITKSSEPAEPAPSASRITNENNISILINDNGKGFYIEKVYKNSDKHGFGLKGIRERVKLFNGKLEIQSSPETGTEFMVSVPIGGK